ncbi:MAG: hypothetical protein J6Z17_05545 [Treponema sp.]|nr:hypothetical protein [Treponema sp.]
MPFTNHTLMQFLTLLLLFISCTRFLFFRRVKEDTFASLPLIAFCLSVLSIFAFGFSIIDGMIFITASFVFFFNIRAFIRLCSGVVIEGYRIVFMLVSVTGLAMTVFTGMNVVKYTSLKPLASKYDVSVSVTRYAGSFTDGFSEKDFPFIKTSAVIHKISPVKHPAENGKGIEKAVLFVPPMTASYETYEAFLFKIAREGYNVYCADFFVPQLRFTDDYKSLSFLRSAYLCYLKIKEPETFKKFSESNRQAFVKEYLSLLKITGLRQEDFVAAILDYDDDFCHELLAGSKIDFAFNLNRIKDYTTPGFGPVADTRYFIAEKLGVEKETGFFLSNSLGQTVTDLIKSVR